MRLADACLPPRMHARISPLCASASERCADTLQAHRTHSACRQGEVSLTLALPSFFELQLWTGARKRSRLLWTDAARLAARGKTRCRAGDTGSAVPEIGCRHVDSVQTRGGLSRPRPLGGRGHDRSLCPTICAAYRRGCSCRCCCCWEAKEERRCSPVPAMSATRELPGGRGHRLPARSCGAA